MDGADVSPDQWRQFLDATLRAVPRPARRPAQDFCMCCGEEIENGWLAQHPETRICRTCDEEMGVT